jgi:hypothetical protein
MGDVLVAAIGALGGFLAAFAAEPIKTYFSGLSEKRRLRNAIYREMGYSYYSWNQFFETLYSGALTPLHVLSNVAEINHNDSYQFAKTQPFLFYALPEAAAIDTLYGNFRHLSGLSDIDIEKLPAEERSTIIEEFAYEQIANARVAVRAFENILRGGEIDTQQLLEKVTDDQRQLLAQTLQSTQRSIIPDEDFVGRTNQSS